MTANNRQALIALGSNDFSNWGDARETIQKAMLRLQNVAISGIKQSRLYQTPAFPNPNDPPFVNAAVALITEYDAQSLLRFLHDLEAEAGRVRKVRWGQRVLDIDLIALGELILPDLASLAHWLRMPIEDQTKEAPDQLILPHPRMQDRSFVLIPLADVAPDWRHPVLKKTVLEMIRDRPVTERQTIEPLD